MMKSDAQGDDDEAPDADSEVDRVEGIDDASQPASDAGDTPSDQATL